MSTGIDITAGHLLRTFHSHLGAGEAGDMDLKEIEKGDMGSSCLVTVLKTGYIT